MKILISLNYSWGHHMYLTDTANVQVTNVIISISDIFCSFVGLF